MLKSIASLLRAFGKTANASSAGSATPVPRPKATTSTGSRAFSIDIVGESNYGAAIARCAVGDAVRIVHEAGNPYDPKALAVTTASGDVIGYIAKSHWLRGAVHREGKGCEAAIEAINAGPRKLHGVVLRAKTCAGPIATRTYPG